MGMTDDRVPLAFRAGAPASRRREGCATAWNKQCFASDLPTHAPLYRSLPRLLCLPKSPRRQAPPRRGSSSSTPPRHCLFQAVAHRPELPSSGGMPSLAWACSGAGAQKGRKPRPLPIVWNVAPSAPFSADQFHEGSLSPPACPRKRGHATHPGRPWRPGRYGHDVTAMVNLQSLLTPRPTPLTSASPHSNVPCKNQPPSSRSRKSQ